jgi:minor extracellular protease Epr
MTLLKTTRWLFLALIIPLMSSLADATGLEQNIESASQVIKIDSVLSTLRLPVDDKLPESELNDRLMLPIDSLVTAPLNSLPDTLGIGSDILNPAWTEVKVDNNWRAVKNQWIVLADENTKSKLYAVGASIQSSRSYEGLKLSLLRFTVPDNLDSKQALANYLSVSAMATLDRNHIYQAQSVPPISEVNDAESVQVQVSQKPLNALFCANTLRIGMIDSAVDQTHPVFINAKITAKSFLSGNVKSPTLHGTAVASVMLGKIHKQPPLLKGAHLYSAEVFYRQSDYAQGATLDAMIEAINWLLEENIKVINMSLAGPDNAVLNAVINAAHRQGAFIVAAAGNEGPAADAVFPAGYEDVIAVSAVDHHQQPYRWSNQGAYIDFAALGVDVLTAQPRQRTGLESGTSIAAPVVSAALACMLASIDASIKVDRNNLLNNFAEQAIDLGPEGKDPIFGLGLIQP